MLKKSLHSLPYINGFDEGHAHAVANIVPQLEEIAVWLDDEDNGLGGLHDATEAIENLIKELKDTDETPKS
jgi:hypothetical protein